MTSRRPPPPARATEAFVWFWLPGTVDPVVAGRLARDGDRYLFNYGRSYLERADAIPLYEPELPLGRGAIPPADGLALAGCLRDGAPDAWGRRVIVNGLTGSKGVGIDVDAVDELTFLLASGSDRVGALDYQRSASGFVARGETASSLDDLLSLSDRVERGLPVPPELALAAYHGTSLGGARPKAAVEDAGARYIAKFSSSGDVWNVVKTEFVAMRLAARVGLRVAEVRLSRAAGRDVLLVKRFDRERGASGWTRRPMVSALTILALDEMLGRYASYQDLAEVIRARFTAPRATLEELFGRLVWNVLCGNTDDHARNHAAFWDGTRLTLTPAYDICPQSRSGREANQAMILSEGRRASTLANCLLAAPHFQLDAKKAERIIRQQLRALHAHWSEVADEAGLSKVERKALWGRQFVNAYAFEDAPRGIAALRARASTA